MAIPDRLTVCIFPTINCNAMTTANQWGGMEMEMAFGVGLLTVLSAAIALLVFGGIYYGVLGK